MREEHSEYHRDTSCVTISRGSKDCVTNPERETERESPWLDLPPSHTNCNWIHPLKDLNHQLSKLKRSTILPQLLNFIQFLCPFTTWCNSIFIPRVLFARSHFGEEECVTVLIEVTQTWHSNTTKRPLNDVKDKINSTESLKMYPWSRAQADSSEQIREILAKHICKYNANPETQTRHLAHKQVNLLCF